MKSLVYLTILVQEPPKGPRHREIRVADTLQEAEEEYKAFLERAELEEKYDGYSYRLSTYKATEIMHSEKNNLQNKTKELT